MVKINRNFLKSDKIIALSLAFIIMTMAMIPGYNITGSLPDSVYAQEDRTGTGDGETAGTNVTETDIPDAGNLVPNEYVVVLKENATFTPQLAENTVSSLNEEWSTLGLNVTSFPEVGMLTIDLNQTLAEGGGGGEAGVAADASVADILERIQNDPNVDYVEPNQIFGIEAQKMPTGIDRSGADKSSTMAGDGQGNVTNVNVAIIDTGIDLDHPDLNVIMDKTFVPGTTTGDDDNGHGTHVAGIVAAKDNSEGIVGVAPGANLIAIKVLANDGRGTTIDIIKAINWITANRDLIDIVNMSLGGGDSRAMNDAIKRSVQSGITYVAAAGNESENAERSSPANSPHAITVSAIADSDGKCGAIGPATGRGADDSFATYSNFGSVVDIAAPGTNILSTYPNGQYKVLTGTSMAAPHVAGAAALWVSNMINGGLGDPTPRDVKDAIVNSAIRVLPVNQCIEDKGYFSNDPDILFREPLLFVTSLSPPRMDPTTVNEGPLTRDGTLQPQRYVLEATDTRNPGSVFTLEVNSLGKLQDEINRLVQGEYDNSNNTTTTAADFSSNNNTILVNNVDRAIDSIANLQQSFTTENTQATPFENLVDANICFNIGWFKVCVVVKG
jgi:subtilisin family serine protease